MLFNSFSYLWFLPLIFLIYWTTSSIHRRFQNILLLTASYYFYSCWDVRFLSLLVFSTALDFFSGILISSSTSLFYRRIFLTISLTINVGFLAVFKYFNFFADNMNILLHSIGLHSSIHTLNIVLPVGISFYTFHGISYVLDIYSRKISVEKDFVDYSLFVSFFPLLVAGPIERATHLLPQIKRERMFNADLATEGLRRILWGLFKKVVIADNCAPIVEMVFNGDEHFKGATLLVGAFLFTIQIYGDFSGYSDIAIGSARLLGFELLHNFNFPYFAQDIADFWRRWHMSLSSWFRDYLYIPLGGSKTGKTKAIRNTFVVFLVSGFWHGANWTFVTWGLIHALFFLPLLITNQNKNYSINKSGNSYFPSLKKTGNILFTFFLVMNAWILFRADNLLHAFNYINDMYGYLFGPNSNNQFMLFCKDNLNISLFVLILVMFITEWYNRHYNFGLGRISLIPFQSVRWLFYLIIFLLIIIYGNFNKTEFIYFAF